MKANEQPPVPSTFPETSPDEQLMKQGESLDEYFTRMGEEVPPVEIELLSGPHVNAVDAREIGERLASADIYIPEFYGWKEETHDEMNRIATGEATPEVAMNTRKQGGRIPSFTVALESHLYGTGKPVTFIDYPQDVAVERWDEYAEQEFREGELWKKTFEEAKEQVGEMARSRAERNKTREAYMYSRFGPQILEVLKAHPELKKQGSLKVFLTLGAGHTDIFHQLKASGTNIHRDFSDTPFIYDHSNELSRQYMFGKDVDGSMKEKALVNQLTLSALDMFAVTDETHKAFAAERALVELLYAFGAEELFTRWSEIERDYEFQKNTTREQLFSSHDKTEARALFFEWRKEHSGDRKKLMREFLDRKFSEKGMHIPTGKEELETFLATYAPHVSSDEVIDASS